MIRFVAALLAAVAVFASPLHAATPDANFMLVLREQEGANRPEFAYAPIGPITVVVDGEEATFDNAWYGLLGDLVLRFVEDGEMTMRNLTAEEFAATGLDPQAAVDVAMANIHARYGKPEAKPLMDGIFVVEGQSPDFHNAYFLDRAFWDGVLAEHPEGVIVGVPQRVGLVFAPLADAAAVAALESRIEGWFLDGGRERVSSALYRYGADGWKLHRAPAR